MSALVRYFEASEDIQGFLAQSNDKLSEIVEKEIGDVVIHFIFVDSEIISEMNKTYRGKEGPTDVLTFVYGDSRDIEEEEQEAQEATSPYAEGYICLDVVRKNAEEFRNSFEKELLTVLVHSILHMAGYDHEYDTTNAAEMFQKQDAYLKDLINE
ncbi:probable rRNA maturation factor [Fervidobacterium changbaicum]|uniref:Endoribonuclease YbeY n=2 Tax=Fervidobacterium TaxID=2422 RepID=A0AAI8CLJ0_FERIS|nr:MULTISPECIES: rRNA maturation RNase YbeY [Fervidobacterium]AMW32778.1 rRNA maturation RNase YbeY [Fervidobacterium islandicum]QAV32814.1 rRNA maturation RNase YbeY [Fervidobacterium changbaicum]SDG94451.1 probable rRNA maturation factor [Fervidobacterium changbaicum]